MHTGTIGIPNTMKIPHQIFGVAIFVFTLMGSTILFSTYKFYQGSGEVTDLAEVFTPLFKEITESDLQIAQQELLVERLEKYLTVIKLNDEKLHVLAAGIIPEQLQAGPESLAAHLLPLSLCKTLAHFNSIYF